MAQRTRSLIDRINDIDIEDLLYVERDLCYYELVSLGFLLYGCEKGSSEFILQKLVVLGQTPPQGKGAVNASVDILRKYATTINTETWRVNIVEALAIIRAKKVLRKLGFRYQDLHLHYLPHLPELSIHIHPLLKALYKICERLSIPQAGRLVMAINESHPQEESQHLRFYDYSYLEVFLLHWMTRGIVAIGDRDLHGADMQELLWFFKLNDLDSMKSVLLDTINRPTTHAFRSSAPPETVTAVRAEETDANQDSGAVMQSDDMLSSEPVSQSDGIFSQEEFDYEERYTINRKSAGIVLIINQSEFHVEANPECAPLLPRKNFNKYRAGTDVDRDRLKKLFVTFGYTPLVYNNLTHLQMLQVIRDAVKKSLLRDSLIICILTHGMEGVVYGCNSVPVSINTIKAILSSDELSGKPKMLIIQACQKNVAPVDTSVSNSERNVKPISYADMLTAMSSVPGTEALRHTQNGSWFIEALCKHIDKWCTRKHMADILTIVCKEVSEKHADDNEKMLPDTNTRLRKSFYLPSRT